MLIKEVSLYRVTGDMPDPGFPPGDRQAHLLDVYPEFNVDRAPRRGSWRVSEIYVEVHSDVGPSGIFGPIDET